MQLNTNKKSILSLSYVQQKKVTELMIYTFWRAYGEEEGGGEFISFSISTYNLRRQF